MIGETLDGRYEIVRKVGGGGMGAVYEARHKGTGRRVAVKVISGDFAQNKTLLTRFHREAMASGAIETQHIVQVLDTGTDGGSGLPFMVMEYLNGEDLGVALDRLTILPPELALRLTAQACIGLQKAHDANVVHRDIKPGNLFLSKRDDGELLLKLLDFGIAKIKLDRLQQLETSGLTRTGHVLGSPLYMSPEQARGHKNIDHRTDIWSLGIVLYQMLTGRRPHDEIEALGELIIAICSDPPRPVQDLAPWVSPDIAALVHGALRFNPAERYPSASQMLDAIKPLLPNGWSITEQMLVSVDDDARKVVAPRFASGTEVGAHAAYRPSDPTAVAGGLEPTVAEAPLPPPVTTPSPAALAASAPRPSAPSAPHADDAALRRPSQQSSSVLDAPAGLPGGEATSEGGRPRASGLNPERGSRPSEVVLSAPTPAGASSVLATAENARGRAPSRLVQRAAVALVGSAAVAYVLLRVLAPAPPVQATTAAPATAAPVTAAPEKTTESAAVQVATAAPAPPRKVRLVLVPADVSVEVDGRPVTPQNGIIEITGPLNSVHKVRVFRGSSEITGEVTVTESGPSPPKLELEVSAASAPKAQPARNKAPAGDKTPR